MRCILINDTSRYHWGSHRVIQYLIKDIHSAGLTLLGTLPTNMFSTPHWDSADTVILNGEGSIHHDRPLSCALLELLTRAYREGKKTFLINAVFQGMTMRPEWVEALKHSYVSVREIVSHWEPEQWGIPSEIHLDLSYFGDVPGTPLPQVDLVVGKSFYLKDYRPEGVPVVDIFQQHWNQVVNRLRSAAILFTGRHHEMYAACKARCSFAVLSGNTWKNEGLLRTADVDIPVAPTNASEKEIVRLIDECREKRSEFEKLFDWMERQPEFSLKSVLKRC